MPMNAGPEEPIKSSSAGTQLDKVLECLGSINERLDSIEAEDKKRDDAKRKSRKDDDDMSDKHERLADAIKKLDDALAEGNHEHIQNARDDVMRAHEALRQDDDDDSKKRKDAKRRGDDDDDEDREYGEPKRVVADSVLRDNRRREALANIQSRADSVSQALL